MPFMLVIQKIKCYPWLRNYISILGKKKKTIEFVTLCHFVGSNACLSICNVIGHAARSPISAAIVFTTYSHRYL